MIFVWCLQPAARRFLAVGIQPTFQPSSLNTSRKPLALGTRPAREIAYRQRAMLTGRMRLPVFACVYSLIVTVRPARPAAVKTVNFTGPGAAIGSV